jgi:dienelactone hydrolase
MSLRFNFSAMILAAAIGAYLQMRACMASNQGELEVDGYTCNDKSTKTAVYYPDGEGPFNLVLFGHGSSGWNHEGCDECKSQAYSEWLGEVADRGLVVVAPATSSPPSGTDSDPECKKNLDLLTAYTAIKSKPTLTDGVSIFDRIDFDNVRVGIMGHSMGSKHIATLLLTQDLTGDQKTERDNMIKQVIALVFSHDVDTDTKSLENYPSLFLTTKSDATRTEEIEALFPDYLASHKILLNLEEGPHMEPLITGAANGLTGEFLACHLNHDASSCDEVYGKDAGGNYKICGAVESGMETCDVEGTSPVSEKAPIIP